MTEVGSLANAAGAEVARVLTEAFIYDPGWLDVGPDRERHRRPISTLLDVPAFALAGPFAALRGARADAMMKHAHFQGPHQYLWQLAVDPPAQRTGVGRALMARVVADAEAAEVPIYLETTKPENVPYYRSFGFVEAAPERMPRGAPLWPMLRTAGLTAA